LSGEGHVPSHQNPEFSSPGKTTAIIQYPPENIPLFPVQEVDLRTLAKGAETLAFQICIAAGGSCIGAAPGAIAALWQYQKSGMIDPPSLAALIIASAGLLMTVACAVIHNGQKTYPKQLLKEILSRKPNPPVSG